MTPPPPEPSNQPNSAKTPYYNTLKFSKKDLVLAFVIAGMSDAFGAFVTPLPPIGWVADIATALLLFLVLGRQWLLLPGLALEAIPGLGVLPFWLLVVGAIAVNGTRPVPPLSYSLFGVASPFGISAFGNPKRTLTGR
jgi:hypothetical protein